jgi:hypothetical protein
MMENEYADDQIGDIDGEIEPDDLISKEMLDEAVNEFIESQKIRDRKLYSDFNKGEKELVPILRKTKA